MASWKRATSESRVRQALKDLPRVEVVDLTREMDLATASIPLERAYRVNGVHIYLDITNADALLESDGSESERSHKRFLRYLHIFQRIVHNAILATTDVFKVDLQNHRLHLIVYKPYDDERRRVDVAVTVAHALLQLLAKADDLHQELEDARIRVGIESGIALAVRNGTRGDRELLFLGNPANHAAKLLAHPREGIYLGAVARTAIGLTVPAVGETPRPLSDDEVSKCVERSGVRLDPDRLLRKWKDELRDTPLATFEFSRPTPPLSGLDFDQLSPASSRRIEAVALMADVDGFTKFVSERVATDKAGEAVRALHVIRKEVRDVLNDFGGRKVRYLGDCVQGVLAKGERMTDAAATVEEALWCVAAMRDAMSVIHEQLPVSKALGLGIGLDFGPLALTRLGVKGSLDRCIAGRALLHAQDEQERCGGTETAIGDIAHRKAPAEMARIFEASRKVADLTTNRLEALITEASSKEPKGSGGGSGGSSGGGAGGSDGGPRVVFPRAHAKR